MERLLCPLSDIGEDGTGVEDSPLSLADALAHDAAQIDLRRLFKASLARSSLEAKDEKAEATDEGADNENHQNNKHNTTAKARLDPIVQMKDNIFWAREQIRFAIDLLIKLDAHVAMVLPPIPGAQPQLKPLIRLHQLNRLPATSIFKQIDAIRLALAAKKMQLMDASTTLQAASTRLEQTLLNETKFYGSVAVDQLRQHNWILHSDLGRWGRALYVDYGLKYSGSFSQEMCQAFFTWTSTSSPSSSSSPVSLTSSSAKRSKNKITLKYQHGRPRVVQVSFLVPGTTIPSATSARILPRVPLATTYSKIQRALSAAATSAFETELFREVKLAFASIFYVSL
ncbi:hypothetical protein BC830DRAFT_1106268 [Chytriomyces sp. MP71]|nr:hypothetical protein BC830DRAFT_1106268 [Chytriomyces sp. MP71]